MKLDTTKKHSIHLRLNDEQYNFLKEMSDTADIGISDFVRMLVNTTMVNSRKVAQSFETLANSLGDLDANNKSTF